MFYIFIENGEINGCGQCQCLNEEVRNVEVTEEIYNRFKEDNDYYIWNGTRIVDNPNYEDVKQQQQNEERIKELKEELDTIDLKTIRALRAIGAYIGTEADYDKLQEFEQQAQSIRSEIARLSE